ncbi:hypothetical protein, partial [Mycobacterium tuberculosis]|uniref:hypothetical protein n=1 Tax=Mycobacterium tuberculosis TaxID=1773 RepID=UPI0020745460
MLSSLVCGSLAGAVVGVVVAGSEVVAVVVGVPGEVAMFRFGLSSGRLAIQMPMAPNTRTSTTAAAPAT